MGLYDKQQKSGRRGGLFGTSSSSSSNDNPDDFDSFNKRIDNARLRIEDSGKSVQDADQRNWFEKLTNLPQNQNAFFDVLDLLGRPMQAIEGAVVGGQRGDDNVLKDAWKGFSGQEHFSGQQIAQGLGVDNKWAKGALGFGIDVLADPLTYVPGGALLKGAKAAIKPAAAVAKGGYELAEKIPAFGRLSENYFKPGANAVKEGLGQAFIPNYGLNRTLDGGTDEVLVNAAKENENTRRFLQDKSFRDVVEATRDSGGVKTGADVGRIMEAPLKQTANSDELLRTLLSGKPASFDAFADDLQDFGTSLNAKILRSPEVKNRIAKHENNIQRIQGRVEQANKTLAELEDGSWHGARTSEINERLADKLIGQTDPKKVGLYTRLADMQLKKLDSRAEKLKTKLTNRLPDYEHAIDRISQELDQTKRGIVFNPREGSQVVDVVNEKPSLYKKALGNRDEFIDEVSPKGTFEQMVKPEFKDVLQPLAEIILRTGSMKAKNFKGTPELAELKRLFGSNLAVQTNKKGVTRLSLRNKDPNKMYYALEGHDHVIPEELTDIHSTKNPTGLSFKDIRFQNRRDRVDLPRPVRDAKVFSSPTEEAAIGGAAQQLIKSNQNIRDYARESGIEIPELEGYMKHVLSQAERDLRSRGGKKALSIDQGRFGGANPSKKVLASRELTGSVEDVNERIGREFFEPNAFFATAHGQQQLINYIQAVKLRKEVLDNPSFARKVGKGEKVTPGKNEAVIDVNNYKFLRDGAASPGALGSELGKQAVEEIGGQYLVTKGAKALLDRYAKLTSDEGTKAFLKAYDGITNAWKKLALMSPNYAVRNFIGGVSQNFLGGITNPANLSKYTLDAAKELSRKEGSELLEEYRRQGLVGGQTANTFLRSADPEKALNKEIKAASRSRTARTLRNPIRVTAEAGDEVNRLALYKWARDKGMTPEQAAAKVRQVHFDYQELTPVEREVFARVIPFYRWMRKNTPFQINNFLEHPTRYAALNKIRTNAQEAQGLTEENIPDYMKGNYTLPITGDGKGRGLMLGLNLPIGDLSKLSDPLGTVTDAFAEPITLPIELATNRDFFRNRDISQYAGDTTDYGVGGGQLQLDPKLAYAIEALGGQPARLASLLTKQSDVQEQEAKILQPSLGIALPLKEYDAQQFQTAKARQQLQQLLDYIQYLKDNGVEVRDTNQIR